MIRVLLWLAHVHRRLLPLYFAVMGPRAAYAVTGWVAGILLRLLPVVRDRMAGNVRAGLGDHISESGVEAFCRRAIRQQTWNLTDLFLAERLLHRGTYDRFGGRIPEPWRSRLLEAQRRRTPMILVTAYWGPFDLLPLFLGFNGVRAAAVYRAHANPWFDAQRRKLRARSGCELVMVEDAVWRLPAVLERGGTVAVLADHHDERRGVPASFLGLPTRASKSIGLLAQRFDADIVVAGLRRVGSVFRFRFEPIEVIEHADWGGLSHDAGVAYITQRYLSALERLIRLDPTQYLWARARWGTSAAPSDAAIPK